MIEPGRLAPALRTALLGPRAKLELWRHWSREDVAGPDDEAVASYLRRRYGTRAGEEICARIAGPLLAGVYGGHAEDLSLRALRRRAVTVVVQAASAPPKPAFLSLRRGMGSLVDALEKSIAPERLRRRQPVLGLTRSGQSYQLATPEGSIAAAGVIVATPAEVSAALVAAVDGEMASALAAIRSTSSVNLNLGFAEAPPLPAGSGFLMARTENLRMLACTFAHQKFAGRAPAGGALIRVFYGETEAGWPEDELLRLTASELQATLRIASVPTFVEVSRWPRALPQYGVGHLQRLDRIAACLRSQPAMALAGNAYRGVGVPDCIASGRAAASVLASAAVGGSR